jgi:hypothetical protein
MFSEQRRRFLTKNSKNIKEKSEKILVEKLKIVFSIAPIA